jgi:hypothetical protein
MKISIFSKFFFTVAAIAAIFVAAFGQTIGNAGLISGIVTDPNNAVVAGATVTLSNNVTGYKRTVQSGADGSFRFNDVPFNKYDLRVEANGFQPQMRAVTIRSIVPIQVSVPLTLAAASAVVNVESDNSLVEDIPTPRTQIDQSRIKQLSLRTPGNGLSDVVTLTSPGVVADSNGFFHPLGDHAQSQISLDGQPISDQQSKAFSTQIPVNAIESLDIITGAVPAEYGDKTSMVVTAISRSGLNRKKPTGNIATTVGRFRTVQQEASIAYGNERVGNFTAFNFERSNRFLDSPEFESLHNRGSATSVFNHFDYNPTTKDAFHLNLFAARNFFQIANTYEQQALGQNQRQRVRTVNIAPGYAHLFNANTVLTIYPYYRNDQVNYFPSANPFSDQTQTISQSRRLANAGIKTDLSYQRGINNFKFGGQYQQTFLNESFAFGITDPNFNPICLNTNGNPVAGSVCNPAATVPNPNFLPGLLPFDLTRGGALFRFRERANIKQQAVYAQNAVNFKNGFAVSLGVRFDNYNGISKGKLVQPRVGVSYFFKPTNTLVRASFTRNFETPYNENLILSSTTGGNGLADGILGDTSTNPLRPGRRNQFNAGLQQGFGRYVVVDVDYFNKFTRNAYDFNVILNTPITFPISWSKSKIDGVSGRVNLTNYKGFSAFYTAGHTRARFFPPETGGLFFNSNLPSGVFRIDHDQKFQQTAQIFYNFNSFENFRRFAPFISLTYRYDSGIVAGSVPDYATALMLTADQQAQIGLFCGSQFATRTNPITVCNNSNRGALRLRIPADGTANDDTNPPRIAPRNLFDFSLGADNLFRSERAKVNARLTALNVGNKIALYNFLSTFSGTHFVTPRAIQGQIGVTF